ncbi:hypothetical protein [Dawidia soli]|jgi:hypothetical protein|uniref:Uncharacterized protein n=1 Tax=Dawidia soli TaxID=2782352 RepID=A0AAP2D6T5_9BACT|nr:hypothetical protein [Dawidia soli]MBT1686192.1 hypothetical protein [Dawidia soli]
MKNKNLNESVGEAGKGPVDVLGEVLRAYKRNAIVQSHRPDELKGRHAQREHNAEVKRLDYQLGYALHSSLEALQIPADSWQWYLDLLQQYSGRVCADLSNHREVASEVYEAIKNHRKKRPSTGSLVVAGLVNIDEENSEWQDNFENYA